MGFFEDSEQKRIFGYNLELLVDESGKDQRQIAIELDVNPPTFNQWVNGKAIPSVSTLKKISAYFGVTLSQLVNESESEIDTLKNLSNREIALISSYRNSNKGIKDAVDKLLDVDNELDFLINQKTLTDQMNNTLKKINKIEEV